MAKAQKIQSRNRQRLSRKTKKALVNSVGREQFREWMAEQAHNTETKAQAELFSRAAEPPYQIISGKLRRLRAYSNVMSGK